jgi:ABC-type transporter Mla subunit MlaD
MKIKQSVKIPKAIEAQVRTRGVLGDAYIELVTVENGEGMLQAGDEIEKVAPRED